MRTTVFMIATALSATLALPGAVAADKTATAELSASELMKSDFSREKQAILTSLFDAQMSLQQGARTDAERHINKAFETLEKATLAGAPDEDLAMIAPVKVAELKYGSALMPKVIYVPLGDGDLTIDGLADTLRIKGIERGDVEDAEVRYVRLKLDDDKLIHDLNETREELTDNDLTGARAQLLDAQKSMIVDYDGEEPPETVARDHITLTRFMLKANEYEGAREALDVAEAALVKLGGDKDVVGRSAPSVEEIQAQADELAELISRRDPTLADKIDKQLEAWWKSLS
ncbi:MAG: hypothetical protein EP335_07715 [Alphaproteobacteria bacterium]|nr:MAG: hypothetical protein EP335_07715 [Alphaproteobacteria bacterium]